LIFTELAGERVRLIPLEREHIDSLYECARNPGIWTFYPATINSLQEMESFVRKAAEGRERKEQFPYAVFDNELNKFVRYQSFQKKRTDLQKKGIGTKLINEGLKRCVALGFYVSEQYLVGFSRAGCLSTGYRINN
jgi:hypothetical protein